MLNLNRRAAHIGVSFNGRREKHGDEDVPALDIKLEGITLGEKEFNALLGDPHAEEAFFDPPGKTSTLVVPRFPKLDSLKLKDKIKGVKVSIWLDGKDTPILLDGCDLAKITLDPQDGGTVALSCQVQCSEPGDKAVSKLFDHLGATVSVEIVELQTDLDEQSKAA